MASEEGNESNGSRRRSWMIQSARYLQMGFVLPVAALAGWGLGRLLAYWFHASWWHLVGLLIGVVAGFVEVVRTVMSSDWNE